MTELLKPYVPIVDFLADYLGEHTEVVLHDFSYLEHSIVKIRNGHISGRRENDPCTDFVLRKLKNPPTDGDYDASYIGRDCHGSPLKSSTLAPLSARSYPHRDSFISSRKKTTPNRERYTA